MHNIDAANNPMKVLDNGEEQLRTKTIVPSYRCKKHRRLGSIKRYRQVN
jgi:hypothetical protein